LIIGFFAAKKYSSKEAKEHGTPLPKTIKIFKVRSVVLTLAAWMPDMN